MARSARKVLKGRFTQVNHGAVEAELTLGGSPGVD